MEPKARTEPRPGTEHVPSWVIEDAAQVVARQLLRLVDGPKQSPDTWLALGRDLGIVFTPTRSCGLGSYYSPDAVQALHWPLAAGWAVVQYDAGLDGIPLAKVLLHELAHDRLHHWQPPQLPRAADVQSYDDDQSGVHHRVSKRVEEILLG